MMYFGRLRMAGEASVDLGDGPQRLEQTLIMNYSFPFDIITAVSKLKSLT